jgi:Cu-Zn family superoxide dismutase
MIDRLRAFSSIGLALGLLATAAAAQPLRSVTLPDALAYPEGVGLDPAGFVYTASAVDGTVVRTSLKDGRSTVLVQPGILLRTSKADFPRVLGIKRDAANRLWLMGGRTGKVFVVDARSGKLIKEISTPGEGGVLNDAVVTADAAYVTDTLRPILWRIPIKGNQIGEAEPWIRFGGTPIAYSEGLNLNGIALSRDGRSLVVVQMDKGLLFKIDRASKAITPIDTAGQALSGGDGLVLDGTRLYLVRQPEAEVVTLDLTPDLRSARVISRFKDPALAWPATAAKVGNDLLVVNSQFDKNGTNNPVRPFGLAVIPTARLAGK